METNVSSQKHIAYFDGLRALACISVIVLHSAAYVLQRLPLNSLNFWVGNFFDSATRFAVPIFVMLSGALMLDEGYRFTREKLWKHIKSMVCFFVFWSVLYFLVFGVAIPLVSHTPIDPVKAVFMLVRGYYHLWFVPMIIGCYLMVPLLRLWVKQENIRYVKYFLILGIAFGVLLPEAVDILTVYHPRAAEFSNIIQRWDIHYAVGYISYFVCGWYLTRIKISNPAAAAMTIAGWLITCIGTYILSLNSLEQGTVIKVLYGNMTVNVYMLAVGIFCLYKNNRSTAGALEKKICRYSLGIYALQSLIISITGMVLLHFGIDQGIIVFPVCVLLTMGLSLLIGMAGIHIPGFSKLI